MSTRAVLWIIGVAGGLLGLLVSTLIAVSDIVDDHASNILATLLIGWSFLGVGLYAWRSRPSNRIGRLMVSVAFAWMLGMMQCADLALPFTIGLLTSAITYAIVLHLLLAYPTGRVQSGAARAVVAVAYVVVVAGSVLYTMFARDPEGLADPPRNLLLVEDSRDTADTILTALTVAGVITVAAGALLLVARWRAASAPERRSLTPLLGTGALFLAFVAVTLAADLAGSEDLEAGFGTFATLLLTAAPYAYLAGLLSSGWARGRTMGDLVSGLNAADARAGVRDAMAEALGDPTLDVAFKRHDRDEWVDADGRRFELPPDRAVTEIARDGEVIGALVHRGGLADDPELLRAVADTAALALENERLQAELRARVAELQESRANIISFGLAERRRLERDLHDGAQQRLVALSLQVNLARAKLDDDPATAATLLDTAKEELSQALDELRELARGIHPAILTDQGLGPAVSALAERSPVPVEIEPLPEERLPPPVEAAAYFVVSEALANVAKYAQASQATVRVVRFGGHAVVEVADDGVGGADAARGTGLRGLADRVEALDGRLEIVSPIGRGTTVRADLPCASS
ncbi:MAG TPA: sensor histidine kinase [Capillimicrobium sp.]|nr:sensor histidine kinase [Capillimicrobium sp.]